MDDMYQCVYTTNRSVSIDCVSGEAAEKLAKELNYIVDSLKAIEAGTV